MTKMKQAAKVQGVRSIFQQQHLSAWLGVFSFTLSWLNSGVFQRKLARATASYRFLLAQSAYSDVCRSSFSAAWAMAGVRGGLRYGQGGGCSTGGGGGVLVWTVVS